ncbi:hypothetical protein H9Y04_27930 [Streptomyces sp. TRM66268-LWL]|uniref:Integral membrane protein n=1 Tax=Streptomyces polyasparticus TaxID=2767826 RepID=A0ABR7SLL3_9ACTN|nr:hypothetical protein [Streptomyces polyasparticus]MBC9716371.1 hypothetical protein [Streptomyces polyasparticus]
MKRLRNVLGSLLALIGAAAVVWSPFRAWYDGRLGRDYRIDELFSADGVTDDKAQLFGSLFLPFLFVAVVTLCGVALRSRLMLAVAGIVAMGFAILWMVRLGQAEGSLTVDGDGNGLDMGAANALVGGAMILLGSLVMSGRSRRVRPTPEPAPASTVPTLDDPSSFDAFGDRPSSGAYGDRPSSDAYGDQPSSAPPAEGPPPWQSDPAPQADVPPADQGDSPPPPAWHKPPGQGS